jgi:hypothetical protein
VLLPLRLLDATASGGVSYSLACNPGSYLIAGIQANLKVTRTLLCSAGSYSVSGQTALLKRGYSLGCVVGSYTLNGIAANLTYTPGSVGPVNYSLTCAIGSYTLNGSTALLKRGYSLNCSLGSYALNGIAANLTYTPVTPSVINYTLNCLTGSYVVIGLDLTFGTTLSIKRGGGKGAYYKENTREVKKTKKEIEADLYNVLFPIAGIDIVPEAQVKKIIDKISSKNFRSELTRNSKAKYEVQVLIKKLQDEEDEELMFLL